MSDTNNGVGTKVGNLLTRRPKSLLAKILITLLIVLPLAGSAVYMWSMWDPTVYLKQVPIGVVNNDEGGPDGENFGKDVVDGLKAEPYLKIVDATQEEAKKGLLKDHYLFTISIPKDFSTKILTVIDPEPQKARIDITYNDYNGSAGAVLTGGLVPLIASSVTASIGESYAKEILVGMNQLKDGLVEARDGAKQLDDGAAQIQDGAWQIADGTDQLLDGTDELGDGMKQISGGVDQLVDMLVPLLTQVGQVAPTLNGVADVLLNSGIPNIVEQGKKVKEVADTLNVKNPEALVNQLKMLKAGAREVSYNLNDPKAPYRGGLMELQDGIYQLANGTNELKDGTNLLYTGLADGVKQAPTIQDLAASSSQVATPFTLNEQNEHPAQKVVGDISGKAADHGSSLSFVVVIGFLLMAVLSMLLPATIGRRYESHVKNAFLPVLKASAVSAAVGVVVMGLMALASTGIDWSPTHNAAMVGIIVVIGIMAGVAYIFYRTLFGRLVGGIASLAVFMLGVFSFGGVWPLSTTPSAFKALHPLSPMSYARDAFTLGTDSIFNNTFWVAIVVMIVMSILAVVATGVVRYLQLGADTPEALEAKAISQAKDKAVPVNA